MAAMFRTNSGRADQRTATTPATCGEAIDVPLKLVYPLSLEPEADRTFTPGAERLGFNRFGL